MPCDIERVYGKLAEQLPDNPEDGEPFALDETVVPAAPQEISTDRLMIYRGSLQRLPGCRGDQIDIVAPRQTFRQLGLLALAVLFHEQCDRATVHIANSESRVKHLVLEYKHWSKAQVSGFRVRPWILGYVPDDVGPTYLTDSTGFGAPVIRLTNTSDCQRDEHDWQNRDTLWGFGGTYPTAEIAEYLLNAGRKSATLGGFNIPANRAFFAAEVNLWVPEKWDQVQRTLRDVKLRNPKPHI